MIRLKLSLPGSSHGFERANTCRVARQPDSREFSREETEDEPEEAGCPQGRCESLFSTDKHMIKKDRRNRRRKVQVMLYFDIPCIGLVTFR